MALPTTTQLAIGAAGGLLLALVLIDLFITIFAYDGFTFLAPRAHRALWALMRRGTAWLPSRARRTALSLGSTALLPATIVLWLGFEVLAFAMIFLPGLASGGFVIAHHAGRGFGSALYLSGGDLTSLTFGDLVPRAALDRAMVDLETAIGIATFTLAITYVLSAFDTLAKLRSVHARVRRNAVEPHRPSTIIERRYRSGDSSYYSDFLQAIVGELDEYNEGLRRFPVAVYFHTRRIERSMPRTLAALGELIELSRWGLPASEAITNDPNLLALIDEYTNTLDRLERSFLRGSLSPDDPSVGREQFFEEFTSGRGDPGRYAAVRAEAQRASGLEEETLDDSTYERYKEWLVFDRHSTAVIDALRHFLGYGDTRV